MRKLAAWMTEMSVSLSQPTI